MNWPSGFRSAGVAAGIKRVGLDVGAIVADEPVDWAGVFTQNAAAAAPVRWCRNLTGSKVRALVVNSGNANAATGERGRVAVEATATAAASELGCSADEVLISSTGPIGVQLPVETIVASIPILIAGVDGGCDSFAEAIMTTDTHPKTATATAGDATVVGVAKGAAMLAPNMATMLAFLTTDAAVPPEALSAAISAAVSVSFNRISVDACESTNDSVFLLSSGLTPVEISAFNQAVETVCRELAEQIVRDAEGGTKFVRIEVSGASDDEACVELGKSVAASALWKSAVHGSDPNWGRILSALGASDRYLSLDDVEIAIGDAVVYSNGEPADSLQDAAKVMVNDEFTVFCKVGGGPGRAEVLTCDLSPDYVRLNAEGTT